MFCLFITMAGFCQTIVISGQCISGNITATYAGVIDGKPSYEGIGTIAGFPTTPLAIFWIPAPDNLWVIAFDGQPYYTNACNTSIPPGTSPNICQWEFLAGNPDCTGAPLSVTGAVVLPVSLTDFTATASVSNQVLLQWNTQHELNNKGFTIQRSATGQQWTNLSFVPGAGNASVVTTYSYLDNAPLTGNNFYRLQQQDIDGRTTLSEVVTTKLGNSRLFQITNNPGNGIYKLLMPASNGLVEIQVTDVSGRIQQNYKATAGNQLIDISKYAPGLYLLAVKIGKEQTTLKLVRQ